MAVAHNTKLKQPSVNPRWQHEIPLKTADIHTIDTENRLLVLHSDHESLRFQDANLSGPAILTKSMEKLMAWRSNELKTSLLNGTDSLLLPFYRKLEREGKKKPSDDCRYVYRAVVLELLREQFEDELNVISDLFTHWIMAWPLVEAVLDDEGSGEIVGRREEKLDQIPELCGPELRKRLLTVLRKLNKFSWKSAGVDGDGADTGLISFLGGTTKSSLYPGNLSQDARYSHLSRLISRISRIGADITSPAASHHIEDTLAKIHSSIPAAETDIEDGLLSVANTICTVDQPKCSECPLSSVCNGYKAEIADRVFLRLYQRQPVFLSYSITPACKDGLECLLCAQDWSVDSFSTRNGVTRYPVMVPRLTRWNEAVLIIRDLIYGSYLFPTSCTDLSVKSPVKQGRKRKVQEIAEVVEKKVNPYCLLRLTMENDWPPSAEPTLTALQRLLPELPSSIQITVKRDCRADYRAEDIGTSTVRLVYVYVVEWQPTYDTTVAPDQFLRIRAETLMPDQVSQEDWKLFQDFLLFEQLPEAEFFHPEDMPVYIGNRRGDLSEKERLNLLEEAFVKRFNNPQYPKL